MTQPATAYPSDNTQALSPRVESRLLRLGQRVRLNGLGHRRLSETDTRGLTTALLRDIDETILPRHVRVTTNAGQSFALDIAGRRLLSLIVSGSGGSAGQPDDPAEAAQALAQELHRALLRATEVTVQSYRMDSAQDRTDVGSSASALATALGLDLDAFDGEDVTDRVLRGLSREADATLVLDGRSRVTNRVGDATGLGQLDALVATHLPDISAAMRQAFGRNSQTGCMTLGTDAASGKHLICAFSQTAQILALVDARNMGNVLPLLQDTFAK